MPEDKNCPICTEQLGDFAQHGLRLQYSCPNCGEYGISTSARESLNGMDHEKRALLSYVIRKRQRSDELIDRVSISAKELENIIENSQLPPASERADNLVLHLGETLQEPGTPRDLYPSRLRAVVGAMTDESVKWLLKELLAAGTIDGIFDSRRDAFQSATLTLKGWDEYHRILAGNPDSRKAFMAMKFGQSDVMSAYRDCFRRAAQRTGFNLIMLAESERAGLIDDRMRVEIRSSRFVIADLTHGSSGAYWEAGFAEGLGRPVIYTCRRDEFERQNTHFDTNHHLTVCWDAEDLAPAEARLVNVIRATFPDLAKQEN